MTKRTRKPAKPARPTKAAKSAAKRAKAASQVAPAKKTTPAKPPGKVYVLLGADEYAKPRAARFSAEDPELLAKAAASMSLRLVEVTEPDVAEIAAKLPAGRLHANGKGLVPYIKGALYYDLLLSTLATQVARANPDPAPQDLPRTWDDLVPGHLVIARDARSRVVGSHRDRADRRPGHGAVPRLSAVPAHGPASVSHRADHTACPVKTSRQAVRRFCGHSLPPRHRRHSRLEHADHSGPAWPMNCACDSHQDTTENRHGYENEPHSRAQ
jgi:hypothetical protein